MHHLTVEGLHNEFDNDADESTINDIISDNDKENDCGSESDVFEVNIYYHFVYSSMYRVLKHTNLYFFFSIW